MLLSSNVDHLMTERGVSNNRLGKELGISPEAIRSWRTGTKVPTVDKLLKLADYFGVSLDSLMGKHLDTEQTVDLPIIGAINAGTFTIENDNDWQGEFHSVSLRALKGRPKSECVLLKVVGESMVPLVYPDEFVVVHRQPTAVNGNIVVAYDENEGGYTLKRFAQYKDEVKLIPANDNFKEYIYSNPSWQQLKIWGVCLSAERSLV